MDEREYPEVNLYTEGQWFGPDYPANGMPKYHTEAIDGPLPDEDYDNERREANRGQASAEPQQPTTPVGEGAAPGQGSGSDPVKVPPRKGAGSSKEAWAKYAEAHDVDIATAESRDDIIDACEAAGVATE